MDKYTEEKIENLLNELDFTDDTFFEAGSNGEVLLYSPMEDIAQNEFFNNRDISRIINRISREIDNFSDGEITLKRMTMDEFTFYCNNGITYLVMPLVVS